jgi:hypothetical protein
MTSVCDTLARIKRDLDFRGDPDWTVGVSFSERITLTRAEAEQLHAWALQLKTAMQEIHALAEIATVGNKGKGSMSERLEKIWKLSHARQA